MPIIIVSADIVENEQRIAEMTAASLGYQLVGPEILASISAASGLPEATLIDALTRTPSPGWGFTVRKRDAALSDIEAGVLTALTSEETLCWGVGAHMYVRGVAHALKVRLISDPGEQARALAEAQGTSPERAVKTVAKAREARKRWSRSAYDRDEFNPNNYDLVINLSQISPEEAVSAIVTTVGYRKFKTTTYSSNFMKDLALAARVRQRLIQRVPGVRVVARDGKIVVDAKGLKREVRKKTAFIKASAATVEGVSYVEVRVNLDIFGEAMQSMR